MVFFLKVQWILEVMFLKLRRCDPWCTRRTLYNVVLELYITQGLLWVHFIFLVSPGTLHTIPINRGQKFEINLPRDWK